MHSFRQFVNSSRVPLFLLAFCTIFGLSRAADAGSPFHPVRGEAKRTIVVKLSPDPGRRMQDLAELAKTDLLGVDHRVGEAAVHVTSAELRHLSALGFRFAFAPSEAWESEGAGQWSLELGTGSYLQPSQVVEFTQRLQRDFPALVKAFELGKTTRGRPIMALEITSPRGAPEKPAVLFNGMHHARELMTTEVMVDLSEQLASGYGRDPEITAWLDAYRVFVIPQVNPDGNQLVHEGSRMWRKNAATNGRTTFGVDLNRNYPLTWNTCNGSSGSTGNDAYRGPSAASEPETKALVNFIGRVRPVANLSYHSFSEMILYPFGCAKDRNPMLDLYKDVASGMRASIADDSGKFNTYQVGTPPELLYSADGDDMSWQFKQWHVISLALEINSRRTGFQPDFKTWRNVTVERQRGGWKSILRRMGGASVKAQLRSNGRIDEFSYQLFRNGSPAAARPAWQAWAPEGVQPARVRTPTGLVFLMAMPGNFELRISRGGQVVKSVPVQIANRTVDLGIIAVD